MRKELINLHPEDVFNWNKNFPGDASRFGVLMVWLVNITRLSPSAVLLADQLLQLPSEASSSNAEECENRMLTILDNWVNRGGEVGGQLWSYQLEPAMARENFGHSYGRPEGTKGERISARLSSKDFFRDYRGLQFELKGASGALCVQAFDPLSLAKAATRLYFYCKRNLLDNVSIEEPGIEQRISRPHVCSRAPSGEGHEVRALMDSQKCPECGEALVMDDPMMSNAIALREAERLEREALASRRAWKEFVTPERLFQLLQKARAQLQGSNKDDAGWSSKVSAVTLEFMNGLVRDWELETLQRIDFDKWWTLASAGVRKARRDVPCGLPISDASPVYELWRDTLRRTFMDEDSRFPNGADKALERLTHDAGCISCYCGRESAACQAENRLRGLAALDLFFVFIGHTPVPRVDNCKTRQTQKRIDDLYQRWLKIDVAQGSGGSGTSGGDDSERSLCLKCAAMRDRFVRNELTPVEAMAFRAHVSECAECYWDLQAYIEDERAWNRAGEPNPVKEPEPTGANNAWNGLRTALARAFAPRVLIPLAAGLALLAVAIVLGPKWRAGQSTALRQRSNSVLGQEVQPRVQSQGAQSGPARGSHEPTQVAQTFKQTRQKAVVAEGNKPPKVGVAPPEPAGPSEEKLLASMLKDGKVHLPDEIRQWDTNEDSAVLGAEDSTHSATKPISPFNTVVATERPAFRWKLLGSGQFYRLNLRTLDRAPVATVVFRRLPDSNWEVTEYGNDTSHPVDTYQIKSAAEWHSKKVPALDRGQAYSWWVDELANGEPEGAATGGSTKVARFSVLDSKSAAALRRERGLYAKSPLLLAVCYAQKGLIESARKELRLEPDRRASRRIMNQLPKAP